MSNQSHTIGSPLHRLGVVGPVSSRAFPGSSARSSGGGWVPNYLVLVLVALTTMLGALAFAAVPAMAETIHVFSTSFASAGEGAGELSSPDGVAVNSTTHDIYVADTGNDRIDEFEADGNFVRAWGWGVAEGVVKKEEFQTCTLTCFKGLEGSKPGEFTSPEFVAVDNSGGPSNGDVYVGDRGDGIVSKFSAEGKLEESWGTKGQLDGSTTTIRSFGYAISGVAVDGSGTLMVLGRLEGEVGSILLEGLLFRFTQGGVFSEELNLVERDVVESGLAVDSEDNFFKVNHNHSTEEFTSSGSDLGQVTASEAATGLAVDSATGDLYVDVGGDVEAYAFSAAGIVSVQGGTQCRFVQNAGCPASYMFGSSKPSGGSLSGASGIAVDSSSGGSSSDDVYVADTSDGRVDVFTPEIVPDVTTEAPSGLSETTAMLHGTVNPDETEVTACKFEYGTERGVYPNTVACSQTLPLTGDSPVAVSAPPLSGLTTKTTYYYRLIATNANGTNYDENSFTTFGTPTIESESSDAIGHTSAALEAQIDPNGSETHYHFEYGSSTSYGTSVPIPDGALAAGFTAETVGVNPTGLVAGATYHFRVVAVNAESSTPTDGPDQEFTTIPAARIENESVSHVAATSVTLGAQIDPLGTETSAYFQYGTVSCAASPASCTNVPLPPGRDIGSAEGYQALSEHLQDLAPSTTYYYRVIASNVLGTVEGEHNAQGEEVVHTFTTQPPGSSRVLPDDRQWELVSPPNKFGALIYPINEFAGVIQAAADGAAITYGTSDVTEAQPRGSTYHLVQVLSRRGAGASSWSSQDIETPNNYETGVRLNVGYEYRFFSSDLSLALLEPEGAFTPLERDGVSEEVPPRATERTAYLRSDFTCQATPSTCYTPLVTEANTRPETKIGGNEENLFGNAVEFVGATPDLSHVVLTSNIPLIEGASYKALYEWAGGRLQPVSVLPLNEGGAWVANAELGGLTSEDLEARNAISTDGSRVVWSDQSDQGLYMSDTAGGKTESVRIGGAGAEFMDASSDDSKVFFTEGAHIVGSETHTGDLYVFEVTSGEGEPLVGSATRLTEGAEVHGTVLGVSEDGSYVYFVANGLLGDAAEHGASAGNCEVAARESCNLYVDHYNSESKKWEAPSFIVALSGADYPDWSTEILRTHTSRVSPNGRYLAFMSDSSLTGYDNIDLNEHPTGQEEKNGVMAGTRVKHYDQEVYLYDAVERKLVCASCNPTGARPVGVKVEEAAFVDDEMWRAGGAWLSANVPGFTPYRDQQALYQSRYLSDSGRLFFNSHEALVPQDVNGQWDVYEYEPPGIGDCTAVDVMFSPRSGGCVGLISSGESAQESGFLDASENGDDVFFLTTSRLSSQDFDDDYDVYDAHVCGAEGVACAPVVTPPPPCTTEASCKPAPTPQPTLYAPPASATFNGPGNLAPPPAVVKKTTTKKTVECKKGFVKNKKDKCVRSKSKKKAKKSSANRRAKS
jgi:hypothetical protein